MKTFTVSQDNWQVTVPMELAGYIDRPGKWGNNIGVVITVKWGDTVILASEEILFDQEECEELIKLVKWAAMQYRRSGYHRFFDPAELIAHIRKVAEDEIRWSIERIVDDAVDWQVEYDTEHTDSLQDNCNVLTEEIGYVLHERQGELIAYLQSGWEVTENQAIKVIEAIDRYDCEGRYSGGFWDPKYNDCFTLNSMCAGEVAVELEFVFQGVSRDEIKEEIGSEYAHGGADGAFYAVIEDAVLEDKVNNVIEEECGV